MIFRVDRASLWSNKEPGRQKPCEEAIMRPVWANERGYTATWAVEFNTLENLMKFIEKYEEVVISIESGIPEILIYDSYIE